MVDLTGAVFVDPPLRGEWMAINTPAARDPSHGTDYFGQRYAFDFIRCLRDRPKPHGRPTWRHVCLAVRAESFLAWGGPVVSAFADTVVAVGDGWPDRLRVNAVIERLRLKYLRALEIRSDYRPLVGNFVMVEGEPGVALYAHLRETSVRVACHQHVERGDPLGAVSNSGRSTMPHLHFQVMTDRDPLRAAGTLCGFHAYQRERNGGWEPVVQAVPDRLERVRFA